MKASSKGDNAPSRLISIGACIGLLALTVAVYIWRSKRDFSKLDFGRQSNLEAISVGWRALRDGNSGLPLDRKIRIPGFMVPLEDGAGEVTEFLLIPYARGCAHGSVPPPDQVVHVELAAHTHAQADTRHPVWVYGTLTQTSKDGSAYHMLSTKITPFER